MKRLKLFLLAMILIPCAAIFVACGEAEKVKVDSVLLDKATLVLDLAETSQLTATISPAKADDKDIEWTTSNSAVATVSDDGLVTAVARGTATITATASNNKKAECQVTVRKTENVLATGSIQTAIDGLQKGDRIIVAAGTYNEQLVIEKDLEIVGNGNVIIAGPADYSDLKVVKRAQADTSWSLDMYGLVVVKDANVTLKNITIQGNPELAYNHQVKDGQVVINEQEEPFAEVGANRQIPWQRYTGVLVYNAEAELENVKILDIKIDAGTAGLDQMQTGYGIIIAGTNPSNLVVKNCQIKDFQKNAICAPDEISSITVTGTTIEGTANNQRIAQNGIVAYGQLVAEGNTLKNLNYTVDNQWKNGSQGIVTLYESNKGKYENNTFENVDINVGAAIDDFYRNDGSINDWNEPLDNGGEGGKGLEVVEFQGGKVLAVTANSAELNYDLVENYTSDKYDFVVSYDVFLNSDALTGTTIGGANVFGIDVGLRDLYDISCIPVFGAAHNGKVKIARHPSDFATSNDEIDGNKWYTVKISIEQTSTEKVLSCDILDRETGEVVYTIETSRIANTVAEHVYMNVYYPSAESIGVLAYLDNIKIDAIER